MKRLLTDLLHTALFGLALVVGGGFVLLALGA